MVTIIDLETKIYLILLDEKGHSHGELATILNEDKGNLSKKLKELREERRTVYRTSHEDDSRRPHYIKDDPEVFRQILKKLSKRLESILGGDPRRPYSISDDFGNPISALSPRICQLIDKFIKSEYTLKVIKRHGFERTYIIFKEETHGYCDIFTYVELADDLKKRGIISEKDLGTVFLADLQKKKELPSEELDNKSPFFEFEIYTEEFYKEYPCLGR